VFGGYFDLVAYIVVYSILPVLTVNVQRTATWKTRLCFPHSKRGRENRFQICVPTVFQSITAFFAMDDEPARKRQRLAAACTCIDLSEAAQQHHIECVKKFIESHDGDFSDCDALRFVKHEVHEQPG
jgi:hypothetical protein